MKILKEFRTFAVKGNMVDMGIGIVIGGAFSQIVNSFVKDIIMPPLGVLTGNVDFSEKELILKQATETSEAISMSYGLFINSLLNFLIIAIAIFLVIRQMNKIRSEIEKNMQQEDSASIPTKEAKKNAKSAKTEDILLLTEIRDLMKKKTSK